MSRHFWWILGLALVVGGAAIALSSRTSPTDFGWFAYTPLNDDSDWFMSWSDSLGNGSTWVVGRWQLVGYAVIAVGFLVLSTGIGFVLGRRVAHLPKRL